MFFDQLPLSTGEGQQSGNNPPETKTMTLTLSENEMSILYWALNDALIQKRKRVAQMKEDDNEGYLKEMIIELQDDADWIRTIQMQIPAAAIKV